MINFFSKFLLFFGIFFNNFNINAQETKNIHMLLDKGLVVIETFPEKAPQTVKRIQELANEGFYDGLTFHRVIAGFMAQGGDPNGNGTGGSGKNIKAEFNDIKHERGIVSIARSNDPDSADSQFFICYDSHPFLDGQYTAWGKVIQGMNLIERIPEGKGPNGQVLNKPTKIITMRVK
jgi:peptidylprolyl isomerase